MFASLLPVRKQFYSSSIIKLSQHTHTLTHTQNHAQHMFSCTRIRLNDHNAFTKTYV